MREMQEMQNAFFSDPFFATPRKMWKQSSALPKINVREGKGKYIVEAAVPGLSKEDLRIYPDGNRLVIESVKNESRAVENEDSGYIFKELSSRGFSRIIPFPTKIDGDKVSARLENGLLTIEVPHQEYLGAKDIVNPIKIQ
jgi:HSP20 family protein